MSLEKKEINYVIKGGYEIPVGLESKQSDSMLNCDFLRMNKLITKRMTLSTKNNKVSRFNSFKSKNLKTSTTKRLILGLRQNIKNRTRREIAKRKISFTGSSNNIYENFGINRIICKIKSQSARNLKSKKLQLSDTLNEPPLIAEECINQENVVGKGSKFTIISEENSDQIMKEPRKRIKAKSRICLNRVQYRFRTLKANNGFNSKSTSVSPVHAHTSNNYRQMIESDVRLFNYSSDEDMDKDDSSNSATETELNELSSELFNSLENLDRLLELCDSQCSLSQRAREVLFQKFINLISTTEGIETFKEIYIVLKADSKLRLFFKIVNLVDIALTADCSNLEELITGITHSSSDVDFIYSLFNSSSNWIKLIGNKYGKSIVEYLLQEFYCDNPDKHSELFELIDQNFLEYAQSNYTTFVVQAYLHFYGPEPPFRKILKNFEHLSLTRNGVFVIIAGLKGYKQYKLQQLLDKIINNSEYLCTSKYASTMMEFVFRNFGFHVHEKFIQKKLNFLYGNSIILSFLDIINNSYGNFIIQKLLHLVSPTQRKTLLNEISEIVPYLPKKNVKTKWNAIIDEHHHLMKLEESERKREKLKVKQIATEKMSSCGYDDKSHLSVNNNLNQGSIQINLNSETRKYAASFGVSQTNFRYQPTTILNFQFNNHFIVPQLNQLPIRLAQAGQANNLMCQPSYYKFNQHPASRYINTTLPRNNNVHN